MDRITDTSKNITLATTSLQPVKIVKALSLENPNHIGMGEGGVHVVQKMNSKLSSDKRKDGIYRHFENQLN